MKILVEITDPTYKTDDGDAFTAVVAALDFFEIPALITLVPEEEA